MPLAKPNKDESQKEFITRCMIDPTMKAEYKNKSQRLAVCYQQWKNK
jgi:hypothetical protein